MPPLASWTNFAAVAGAVAAVAAQRMGLLVTGLQLVCCWRYLAALVEGFESRVLNCIWEIWVTAVIAFVVGQIVKYFTP